jgi:hypothetical protein
MTKLRVPLALVVVLGALAGVAAAAGPDTAPAAVRSPASDADLATLVDTIRMNKKALVSASLNLTPEQAEKFWPVYDRYQTELAAIQDRYLRIIKDYRAEYDTLTDAQAIALIEEYLDTDRDRAALRRNYLPQFTAVMPGRDVARFDQIENKMEAILRYDLASSIPVVK